jgi:hypothetical protein
MGQRQEKYDRLCDMLEDDFRELEDAEYEIQNVVDDVTMVADRLKGAVCTEGFEDPEELSQAIDEAGNGSFVSDLEDSLAAKRINEDAIPKLVKTLTGLEKQLEIRYRGSNFIDILKSNKRACLRLGIDIPKSPKSKKK